MDNDALEKVLSANLARVNDWLKFAETKNAALLTFTSAWLLAVSSLWSNDKALPEVKWPMLLACPALLLAAFIALIALLPRKQRKEADQTAQALTTSNLLFHGNLEKLDIATASHVLRTRYGVSTAAVVSPSLITDLSTQLVETSAIATVKFRLFSAGATCVLVAFVIGATTFLAMLLAKLAA